MPFNERLKKQAEQLAEEKATKLQKEENDRNAELEAKRLSDAKWEEIRQQILSGEALNQIFTELNDPELLEAFEACAEAFLSGYFKDKSKPVFIKPTIYKTDSKGNWLSTQELLNSDNHFMARVAVQYGIFKLEVVLSYSNSDIRRIRRVFSGYPDHYYDVTASDNDSGHRDTYAATRIGTYEADSLEDLLNFIAQVLADNGKWSDDERRKDGFVECYIDNQVVWKTSKKQN